MADQIDSVSGGGNGFSVASFSTLSINFDVPASGSFDIYIRDTYVVTSSRPNGILNLTLSSIKNYDSSSPATVAFLYPSTGVDAGGVYTSTFTVTWSDPFANYVSISNINTYIEQWWDNEVKPELEAINTTLEAILEQMTPTAILNGEVSAAVLADQFANIRAQLTPVSDEAQTENFADQLSRLRYLADPNATEVSNDKNHGSGIRVANPFSKIQQALLYDSLIEDGQILKNGNEEINDSSLSNFLNSRSNRNNSSTKSAATSALSALITQYENLSSTYLQYK
jgi:hypothetical protein